MANNYENHEIESGYAMKKDVNKKDSISSASIYAALSNVKCEEESIYTTINQTKMCAPVESNDELIISNNNDKKTNKKECLCNRLIFVTIFVLFNPMLAVSLSIWSVYAYIQINSLKVQVENINDKEVQLSNDTIEYIISETNKSQGIGNTCNNMNEIYQNLNLTTLANLINYNTSNYVNTIIENIGLQEDYPATSCTIIYSFHSHLLPGYFWVRSGRSQIIQVYCKIIHLSYYRYLYYILPMWMGVAKLNKTKSGAECFTGLQKYSHNRSSCVAPSYFATCSQTNFSTFGIPYSKVYGIVRAYGILSPNGFTSTSSSINDNYVDGISFTYGMSPNRHHIYTLAANGDSYCTRNRPRFVSNYECLRVYSTNVSLCFGSSCSVYMYADLEEVTHQDIEMRVCRDQNRNNEDIVIESMELYVQ